MYISCRWFLMNAKSKHPDQAWKVMDYLYSDEVLAGYHETGLGMVMVPSILAQAKQPENIQKWPNLAFNDKDQVWPPVPTGVKPEGNDMYFAMTATAVITGTLEAAKAIADLNTRYNAALDKAVADGETKRTQYPDFNPAAPGKSFAK